MSKKASRFAEGTTVPVDRTKAELEALLAKHGAAQRVFSQDDTKGRAQVTFALAGRMARLELRLALEELPTPGKKDWQETKSCPRGWNSWSDKAQRDWCVQKTDQMARESWRRLLLLVKAKLEIIADGVSTFEREFLCDILLPNGNTVGNAMAPQLEHAYRTGDMPKLLTGPGP